MMVLEATELGGSDGGNERFRAIYIATILGAGAGGRNNGGITVGANSEVGIHRPAPKVGSFSIKTGSGSASIPRYAAHSIREG